MPDDPSQFNTDRTYPGRWTITFSNPPINMFVPTTIVELGVLMTDLEADPSVKVVVFQSANPDFFVAHLDVAKAAERPEALGLWREFVLRLASMPVVSIAKIRGRTRGIGNEFVLACDMRFASRQSAVFGNREIGVGLAPGGGALEWLPRIEHLLTCFANLATLFHESLIRRGSAIGRSQMLWRLEQRACPWCPS
jgi:enoyl-CoA hydratase/carnithine racemase